VVPEATGRPAYHPAVLLKIYVYGYPNRVQSSRRLEREAGRNIELMWLTGRLAPDCKTTLISAATTAPRSGRCAAGSWCCAAA
jgi:transposase